MAKQLRLQLFAMLFREQLQEKKSILSIDEVLVSGLQLIETREAGVMDTDRGLHLGLSNQAALTARPGSCSAALSILSSLCVTGMRRATLQR